MPPKAKKINIIKTKKTDVAEEIEDHEHTKVKSKENDNLEEKGNEDEEDNNGEYSDEEENKNEDYDNDENDTDGEESDKEENDNSNEKNHGEEDEENVNEEEPETEKDLEYNANGAKQFKNKNVQNEKNNCLYYFEEDDDDESLALSVSDEENDDFNSEIFVAEEDRITRRFLTKNETVRILEIRARHISEGGKPMIKDADDLDPTEIAILELKYKTSPCFVKRTLPSGLIERWTIKELDNIYSIQETGQ